MIVIKLGLMLAKVLAAIALLLLTAMPANLSAYDPEHDDPERSRKVADRNSFALWSILISCIAGSIIGTAIATYSITISNNSNTERWFYFILIIITLYSIFFIFFGQYIKGS